MGEIGLAFARVREQVEWDESRAGNCVGCD